MSSNRLTRYLFYCLLPTAYCLLYSGCATPKKASPVYSYEQCINKYNRKLFLIGEGRAGLTEQDPKSAAETRARTDLAKQIKVKVMETMVTELIERDKVIKSSAEILAQSIVDSMELKGTYIAYSRPNTQTGMHEAICVLKRTDASQWLSKDIDEAYKLANNYFLSAKKEEKIANLKPALSYLDNALKFLLKGKALQEEYQIITAPVKQMLSSTPQISPPSRDKIQLLSDNILNSIILKKTKGDNQRVILREKPEVALQVRVVYKGKGVPNIPLTFEFKKGTGDLKTRVTTNEQGIAQCPVYKIETAFKPNIISCHLPLNKQIVNFSIYGISRREITRITVAIREENLGRPSALKFSETRLESELSDSGFKIIQKEISDEVIDECLKGKLAQVKGLDIDILIVGKVTAFSPTNVEGYFFIARSQAVVKAIDINKGVAIISCETEEKSGGEDRVKAGISALKKVAPKVTTCIVKKLIEQGF